MKDVHAAFAKMNAHCLYKQEFEIPDHRVVISTHATCTCTCTCKCCKQINQLTVPVVLKCFYFLNPSIS